MEARDLRRISVEDYVALDRSSDQKWEYVNGEAFAASSTSLQHSVIKGNLAMVLHTRLRGGPAFPLVGQKVACVATGSFHYPDVLVVRERPRVSAMDEHALTNPAAVFEVLSPSTAAYDRGEKFDHYKTILELREYVVVFQDQRRVEHRKRVSDTQWLVTDHIGGEIALEVAGITLTLDEIYENLERVEPAS